MKYIIITTKKNKIVTNQRSLFFAPNELDF